MGIYTFESKVEGSVVTLYVKDFDGRIVAEGTRDNVHAASEDIQKRTRVEGIRLTLQQVHLLEPSTETPEACTVCGKLIKDGEFEYRLAKVCKEPAVDGLEVSFFPLYRSCAPEYDKMTNS